MPEFGPTTAEIEGTTDQDWVGGSPVQRSVRDPFETSRRLAFFASFIHMRCMTVAVITFANLRWRST
jgi:hypothetical protein